MTNYFLIGFMGAGKSTIAAELVKRTGKKLVEMDAQIVEEQGMSINDIFAQFGEQKFRNIILPDAFIVSVFSLLTTTPPPHETIVLPSFAILLTRSLSISLNFCSPN